jgi:hypothetical protein
VEVSLQQLARALNGKIRNGQVIAAGPGHSPDDESLSVTLSDTADGGFIVKSFAEDDWRLCKDFVLEKLGLPKFQPRGRHNGSEDLAKVIQEAVAAQHQAPKSKPTATYSYTDRGGELLYQVLRYEPKTFRQRRPNGKGWIWKLEDRRVLYRWPELLKFPDASVFVTEGEKDCDRIWSLDLCATTVCSGRWTDSCVEALKGRDVLILEDNDDAGRKKAQEAAKLLHDVANTVRIVSLPGLPDHGDVSDWLDMGHSKDELERACFDFPVWEPSAPPPSPPAPPKGTAVAKFPMLKVEQIVQIDAECEYLIDDLFPRFGLVLTWGAPKTGKSLWIMDAVLHVALGWRYRDRHVEQGTIIYLGLEGQRGLRKRILAFIRHHFGDKVPYIPFRLILVPINLVTDAKALIAEIKYELGDERPAAVVIDTLARAMPGSEAKDADMAAFIKAADSVCRAFDCLVPIVHHSGWTGDHSRGHSSLPAAVDVEISIRHNDQGDIIARVERAKDGPSGIEVYSRLLPVDTGKADKNGKPIISMVVVPSDTIPTKTGVSTAKTTPAAEVALQALIEAVSEMGQPAPASNHIPQSVKVVTVADWRRYAYQAGISTGGERARQKAFERASEWLNGKKRVGVWNEFVWINNG